MATTKAANELIKKDNPEMTDDQIAFSVAKMKEYGLVDSGDTLKFRHRRDDGWARAEFLRGAMVKAKVVDAGINYKKAYTLRVRQQGRRARPAAQVRI